MKKMVKSIVAISLMLILSLSFVSCSGNETNSEVGKPTIKENIVIDSSTKLSSTITAVIKTSMGDISIELYPDKAPLAVENFTRLAKEGYYDNVIFHRILNNFMIQGGDPDGTGRGGESIWKKSFKDEFSSELHNYRGALSMANSGKNTNGSQFFIVQAGPDKINQQLIEQANIQNDLKLSDAEKAEYLKKGGTPWLDKKHTVFGNVIDGMDVVDKIANAKVDKNGMPTEETIKISTIIINEA